MLRQQRFIHEMVVHPMGGQPPHIPAQSLIQRSNMEIFFPGMFPPLIIKIGAADGMQHRHIHQFFALSDESAQSRHECIESGKLLLDPPVNVGIVRRIIVLAQTRLGIGHQMGAQPIHPAHKLKSHDPPQLGGGHIPPAAGKGFREHLLLPQLHRHGGDLPHRQLIVGFPPQPVDTGNMLIGVERHHPAAAHQLIAQRGLFDIMSGELHPVIRAPVVHRLGEGMQHQRLHGFPVAIAEIPVAVLFHKQQPQPIKNILMIHLPEVSRHHIRIRGTPALILGLIGKKALNAHGKIRPEALFVCLMGQCNEPTHHCRIADIGGGGGGADMEIQIDDTRLRMIGADEPLPLQRIAHIRRRIQGADGMLDIFVPVLCILQQPAAGKAAGPAVFIVDPRLHAQRPTVLAAGLHRLHPLFGEIVGLQPAAGVHNETAHAVRSQLVDLAKQALFLQFSVP